MAHAITSPRIEQHVNPELRHWALDQFLGRAPENPQSKNEATRLSKSHLSSSSPKPPLEIESANSDSIDSSILTVAPDSIVSIDQHGEIVSFNQTAELTFGHRHGDVIGNKFVELLVAPEWRETLEQDFTRLFTSDECPKLHRHMELMALRADGTTFPAELTIAPLALRGRLALSAFIRDISERKRTEALQRGQNHILGLIATGTPLHEILMEIAHFAEVHLNGGRCSILQLDANEGPLYHRVSPNPDNDRSTPSCAAVREPSLTHGFQACISWPIFSKDRKLLGAFELYLHDTALPEASSHALAEICTGLAGIAIESRAAEERIRHLAYYDGLTSLPNRFLFKEYLDRALRHSQRSGSKFAVLFIDLDKFKEINDTFGHDAGDLVLREIATRMRNCLRHTDTIARMGGDEFYVLVEDLNDSRHVADIAQKLLDEAARPVSIDGQEHSLSASIGISIYPDDGESCQALLQKADNAMYRAKNAGKDGYRFFSAPKNHDALASSRSERPGERTAEWADRLPCAAGGKK